MEGRSRFELEYDIPVIQIGEAISTSKESEKDGSYELSGKKDIRFIVKGGGQRCEFVFKDFDYSVGDVAKLRRIIFSSLQVMAIETAEVLKNTTGLFDEVILQRLGLLPIRCVGVEDVPLILNTEDIEDEPKSGIPFVMNVQNTTSFKRAVTEKDINILDPRCKTVTSNIPIFYLRPGQKFEIVGFIRKGTGKIHSKWIPVGRVAYSHNLEREEYVLKLSTIGQLTCKEIITQALQILEEKD